MLLTATALLLAGSQPTDQMIFWCQSDNAERQEVVQLVVNIAPSDDPLVADAEITIKPLIGFDDASPKILENVQAMWLLRGPEAGEGETFLRIAPRTGGISGAKWSASVLIPSTVTATDPIRATLNDGRKLDVVSYRMTCTVEGEDQV